MSIRILADTVASVGTSDGAGVKLRRSLGAGGARLDPFLMFDEFGTDDPQDYIAGFPPHPHRGFETVTYMLDGHMRHEDHLGNVGELTEGGVQWMTAGRGIIHSEMPQQREGRMRGFQLWINLPAREKMKPAAYRDIPASGIPRASGDGWRAKVIAGRLQAGTDLVTGPISGLATEPVFVDLQLGGGAVFEHSLPESHNAFVYACEGSVGIGPSGEVQPLGPQTVGILSAGRRLRVQAGDGGTRLVLLAGRPLGEPIAQHGPFVMNTREEIEQAIADYRNGTLATPG